MTPRTGLLLTLGGAAAVFFGLVSLFGQGAAPTRLVRADDAGRNVACRSVQALADYLDREPPPERPYATREWLLNGGSSDPAGWKRASCITLGGAHASVRAVHRVGAGISSFSFAVDPTLDAQGRLPDDLRGTWYTWDANLR